MNIDDAVKNLDRMQETATGSDKIALVVAVEFIRRVLRARPSIVALVKAVSPQENLNQKGLFDE